jgi:hypothetical protein
VNALADPAVGKYFGDNFVSSFQKVGTFRIVNGQKQGGNVASYFCAPDGRVLHCVAGPVDSGTLLREAKWVVDTARSAIKDCKGDGGKFKAIFRTAHATKLRNEEGLAVEPVTFDAVEPDPNSPLTYRDPSGRPLAPVLQPAPIEGPDVKFDIVALQRTAKASGAAEVADRLGRRWALSNQGRVHVLMAAHCMQPIEKMYASIFEGILGEQVSTRPVEIVNPFPWHGRKTKGG